MDCGFKMRYHEENHIRKNGRKVKYINFMCGNYARSGKAACSAHIIYQQPLTEIVLEDIQSRAKRVIEDEEKVRQELLETLTKKNVAQQKADKSLLQAASKRIMELERLTQALYEDKVLGNVPEGICKTLIMKYDAERSEKQELIQELTEKLSQTSKSENDIEVYLKRIRKYVAVETLDREMLLELINCIDVGERKQRGQQKYRDIVIRYNLVDTAG